MRPANPPTRESHIEAYLVKCAKAAGGEVRKVKWIGRSGAPDRLLMLPPVYANEHDKSMRTPEYELIGAMTIWVELKAPGKKPKPHQIREHARMRKMGQRVEVIDSYEQVEDLFK